MIVNRKNKLRGRREFVNYPSAWEERIVRIKVHKTYSNLVDYQKLKSVLKTIVFWWHHNLEQRLEDVGQDPDPGGMLDSFDTRPVKHLKSKSSKVSSEKTP